MKIFFNEFFNPASGILFSIPWKQYAFVQGFFYAVENHYSNFLSGGNRLYLRVFFYQWKPSLIWVKTNVQRQNLKLLVKTDFLAKANQFLSLSQLFFKEYFIPVSETHFSVSKKVYCFLFFFHASGYRYSNYREAYLKLSLLLLPTILWFSRCCFLSMEAVFPCNRNAFLWKPILHLVEIIFFDLEIFFC